MEKSFTLEEVKKACKSACEKLQKEFEETSEKGTDDMGKAMTDFLFNAQNAMVASSILRELRNMEENKDE